VPRDQLETVRDFYCRLLGLQEGARPPFSRRGYWLYGRSGTAIVHLVESARHQRPDVPTHLDHVAFRAADPRAVVERLRDAGIPFEEKRIPESGVTQLFLFDPAGVRLELNFPDSCP